MKALLIVVLLALVGCATSYDKYLSAQEAIATAQASADAERYKAMAAIASGGDATARVAAVMAMQQAGQARATTALAPPVSTFDRALQVLGIALPVWAQIDNSRNMRILGTEQAWAQRDEHAATMGAIGTLGSMIQAPAANIVTNTSTNTSTTNTATNSYNNPVTTTTTDNTHTPTVVVP